MKTLSEIKLEVETLASRIDAPESLLPTYGRTDDGARPYIETDDDGKLHYVVVERGEELERKTTDDPDELFRWIFSGVTFSMAIKFEVKNRIYGQDFRRLMFEKQEQLLDILSKE